MKKLAASAAVVVVLTLCLSLLVVPVAGAYIDPGSGSYVLQMAIAGAMAGAMAIRVFWRRITSFFSGLGSRGKRR